MFRSLFPTKPLVSGFALSACLLVLVGVTWAQPGGDEGRGGDDGGRRGGRLGNFGGDQGGFGRGGGRFGGGPPGGFGGRGGRGGGLLGELMNDGTRTEINLTEDQVKQLEEIGQSMAGNREQFGDIFTRMQAAQTEEERNQIRDEMRQRFEDARKEQEEKVKGVLNDDQFKRVNQIQLHRQGTRALGSEDIQSQLGLSDPQKEQLAKVLEERDAARRELGFGASDEDREKFQQEWDAKVNNVLSDDQKKKWTDILGPPPADSGEERGFGRPGFAGPPGSTPGQPPRPPRQIYIEEKPEGAESVLSFGGGATNPNMAPPAAGPQDPGAPRTENLPPTTEPIPGDKKLTFNFRYAPWSDVLKLFAEEAGLSLDMNAVPPGTFNYFDTKQHTPMEALDILNGYLLPKGFCLVRRDRFLVCINIDNEIPPNLVPQVLAEEIEEYGRNTLLTVIFPLEGVDVTQVAAEVDQIKGPQGKVAGLPSTNSLLVTDIGTNLIRIRNLLRDVTTAAGPNAVTFKPYQLQHISAIDAETTLRSLLGLGSGVVNVSAGAGFDFGRGRDSRDSRDSRSSSTPSTTISITTDERTNQLLVSATTIQHKLIEEALKTIDVEGESSTFGPNSRRPYFQVYSVNSADAREVVKTIDALMPGIVVNEDGRNGKIHIKGTPDQHEQVATLIRQMDGQGGSMQMAVIPLANMDPASVTLTLRSMFLKDGELAPTIEADLYGRQLMVRGSPDQIIQIKTLLTQLGEDGTGDRSARENTRIRNFTLSGRDPEELLPLIERMWSTNHGKPLRIVTPGGRSPIDDFRRGGGDPTSESRPAPQNSEGQRPSARQDEDFNRDSVMTSPRRGLPVLTAAQTVETNDGVNPPVQDAGAPPVQDAGEPPAADEPNDSDRELFELFKEYVEAEEQSAAQPPLSNPAIDAAGGNGPQQPSSSTAPEPQVNITVMGDELVLSSADPELLNELEAMLERMMTVLPPRTTWTIFTLQSADASEAALMLDQLLPNANVGNTSSSSAGGMLGGLSSSVSDLGSGLMDMTGLGSIAASGQTLKIIVDQRLNALFVAGPSAQVREVEELLKVLDSNEWPDTFRDKYSRMIPIEHADAQEVYNIVKEVYSVYLEEQNQQRQQRNNPFAAMMGGGSRSSREDENRAPPARLAFGVDTNTNNLIVWADENLFQEVKTLVESIDQAALEARKTVTVISLQNTSSSVMQNTLGNLMPRVKVSTTGSRSTRTTESSSNASNNSNSGSSGGPPSPDQMRSFFEQRMRERMSGGGGDRGSGDSGGRPSFFGGGRPSFGGGGFPFGGRPGGDSGRGR